MSSYDIFFNYPCVTKNNNTPFLSCFSEKDWVTFLNYTVTERFANGSEAMHYLDKERSLYIVVRGAFEVFVPDDNSHNKKTIAYISEGSIFGELSFFDGQARLASVVATEDSEVLILNQTEFEKMRFEEPILAQSFLFELGRLLSLRFRALSAII